MLNSSILETIGKTPLVKLKNFSANPEVNIYAKLEGENPGGSIKDRIALNMVEQAEKKGILAKGKTILEATSGNTGIGLAIVALSKGYQIKLVMSFGVSEERKQILRSFGAELVLTAPEQGTDGAIIKAQEIFKEDVNKYWMPNQFSNSDNPDTHYKYTAVEIINDLPEIDMFVAGLGTSGTLMGVSKKLKEYNSKIQIIAAEPQLKHKLQGLKNMEEAIVPAIYNKGRLDEKIQVSDKIAFQTVKEFIRLEGIFAGMSSGAALHLAREKSKTLKSGNIVVIIPDRGEKYLSTSLFE